MGVRRVRRVLAVTAAGLVILAAAGGCGGDGGGEAGEESGAGSDRPESESTGPTTPSSMPSSPSSTASSTATSPPEEGAASPTCRDGWVTPAPGTPERTEPLDLIRSQGGLTGQFVVDEMRYFTGPDDPTVIEPRSEVVHTWYVKATSRDDPAVRGRFLVRRTDIAAGVLAVAPYESEGLAPGDWIGFVGEGGPATYPGVPGEWYGLAVDLVTGEAWGTHDQVESPLFGLPEQIRGCLTGT